MEKKELEEKISQGYTQRRLAETFDCSQSTIKYWLRKYGLSTNLVRHEQLFCRKCGDKKLDNLMSQKGRRHFCCKQCDSNRVKSRQRNLKLQFAAYKGGKCNRCGYNRCMAALDFHHRDPSQKDLDWNQLKKREFNEVKIELDKCDLVCKNYHAEIHAGVA